MVILKLKYHNFTPDGDSYRTLTSYYISKSYSVSVKKRQNHQSRFSTSDSKSGQPILPLLVCVIATREQLRPVLPNYLLGFHQLGKILGKIRIRYKK